VIAGDMELNAGNYVINFTDEDSFIFKATNRK